MGCAKYVLSVIVLFYCLVGYGVARPDPTLEELDGLLQDAERARAESTIPDYNCDCFVRLNVETHQPEWYCSASSDYECQSISLEELQDIVLTAEETKEWTDKRMKLLAQDMSAQTQCVCNVKISKDDGSIEYYCNELSCYMIAAEVSARRKTVTATTSGFQSRRCQLRDPSNRCCHCMGWREVCTHSQCPILSCPKEEQVRLDGDCCASYCENKPMSIQTTSRKSADQQSTSDSKNLVWIAKSEKPNTPSTDDEYSDEHHAWMAKSSNSEKPTTPDANDQSEDAYDDRVWVAKSSDSEQPTGALLQSIANDLFSTNKDHRAKSSRKLSEVKQSATFTHIQSSDPRVCEDPCCTCDDYGILCMNPSPRYCGDLDCEKPIYVDGQCCPICGPTEEKMSSQSASKESCPYYSESTDVINAFTDCGCNAQCLSQKQDECEGRAKPGSHLKYYDE